MGPPEEILQLPREYFGWATFFSLTCGSAMFWSYYGLTWEQLCPLSTYCSVFPTSHVSPSCLVTCSESNSIIYHAVSDFNDFSHLDVFNRDPQDIDHLPLLKKPTLCQLQPTFVHLDGSNRCLRERKRCGYVSVTSMQPSSVSRLKRGWLWIATAISSAYITLALADYIWYIQYQHPLVISSHVIS